MKRNLFSLIFLVFIMTLSGCSDGGGTTEYFAPESLKGLSLNAGDVYPSFKPSVTSYQVYAGSAASATTVSAEAVRNSSIILIKCGGSQYASGDSINLAEGDNTISVIVQSSDGERKTAYSIIVNRAAEGASGNAFLSDLGVAGCTMNSEFDGVVSPGYYSAAAPAGTSQVEINFEPQDDSASVMFNNVPLGEGITSVSMDLRPGDNKAKITVISENNSIIYSYFLTIVNPVESFYSEGTITDPVEIETSDFSFPGMAGDSSSSPSYYKIDVTEGNIYGITLSELTDDVDFYVYADSDFSILLGMSTQSYNNNESVVVQTGGTTSLYILVDPVHVSGSGSLFNITVTDGGSVTESEGTLTSPVDLGTLDTPWSGRVGYEDQPPSYYQVSVTQGNYYTITLSDITGYISIDAYGDSSFTSSLVHKSGSSEFSITLTAAQTDSLYLLTNASSPGGTRYSISIMDNGPAILSEGTAGSPVDLGTIPVSSSCHVGDKSGPGSYYLISVTEGNIYSFSMTGLSEDADLYVYSDSGFLNELDRSVNGMTNNENVEVVADGVSTLYVFIESSYVDPPGTDCIISVTDEGEAPESEGTAVSPFDLGTLNVSHSGQLRYSSDCYYRVNVTEGNLYSININGPSENVSLYVYSDSGFSNELACSTIWGISDEQVAVVADGISTLYIRIDSSSVNSPGTYFNLTVTDYGGAPQSEGSSSSPLNLGTLDVSYNGQVGNESSPDSFYYVNVIDGHSYTVLVTDLVANVNLYVYGESGFPAIGHLAMSWSSDTDDESVTVTADGFTVLYIRVDSVFVEQSGTYFTLKVDDNGTL